MLKSDVTDVQAWSSVFRITGMRQEKKGLERGVIRGLIMDFIRGLKRGPYKGLKRA